MVDGRKFLLFPEANLVFADIEASLKVHSEISQVQLSLALPMQAFVFEMNR